MKSKLESSIKEKPYLIAYIDLLGIKNKVKADENAITGTLSKIYKIYKDLIQTFNKDYKIQLTLKVFSDNIVFYCPYDESNLVRSTSGLLSILSSLQYIALTRYHILMRGGVTFGSLVANNVFVCGKALLRAYELESEVAIFPRIIIDKILFDELKNRDEKIILSLIQDFDGQMYINTFFCEIIQRDDIVKCYSFIQEEIKNNLSNERVLQKLNWLKTLILNAIYEIDKMDSFSKYSEMLREQGLLEILNDMNTLSPDERNILYGVIKNHLENIERLKKEPL